MRLVRPGSEDEMVAEFLRQEFAAYERYGPDIDRCLARVGASPALVTHPDLTNDDDNRSRRQVLGLYRGYGEPGRSYLTDFPAGHVDWRWVSLPREELLSTLFTRYWAGIWESSRSPRDLATRIREGRVPGWVEGDGILPRLASLVESVEAGRLPPPLILVTADGGVTRVVMEGHTRLTAYALADRELPHETIVLMGRSPDISTWDEY